MCSIIEQYDGWQNERKREMPIAGKRKVARAH
jgi:hypothetical protein